MAYATKYRYEFICESPVGTQWTYRIDIQQEGYTGSVKMRNLGAAPMWRKDHNGHIYGTSLDLQLECQVDSEYAEFYTSDPYKYKVQFIQIDDSEDEDNEYLVWEGFLATELYSEPDILPPYDVTVTATDGLGELKASVFETPGIAVTPYMLLQDLLRSTGLGVSDSNFAFVTGISPTSNRKDLWTGCYLYMDHMNGKTRYEVLEGLLSSLGACITRQRNMWYIWRSADVPDYVTFYPEYTGLAYFRPGGSQFSDTIPHMGPDNMWPVGYSSTEIVPAKKSFTLTTEENPRETISEDSGFYSSDWSVSGQASIVTTDPGHVHLPVIAESSQTATAVKTIELPNGLVERGKLTFRIKSDTAQYNDSFYLYISAVAHLDQGESRLLAVGENGKAFWADDTSGRTTEVDLVDYRQADADGFQVITIDEIPPLRPNWNPADRIEVLVSVRRHTGASASNFNYADIYGIDFGISPEFKGWRYRVNIDNEARGEGEDVDSILTKGYSDNTSRPQGAEIIFGARSGQLITGGGLPLQSLQSPHMGAREVQVAIVTDMALEYLLPRQRKNATLQTPSAFEMSQFIAVQKNETRLLFSVDSCSIDLLCGEMECILTQVPEANISTIDSIVTKKIM